VFYLRAALPSDLEAVCAAASHLDSVNLPNDPAKLARIIERSQLSFSGELPPAQRELLFVAVERDDAGRERAVGASMIFAQHGSRQSPHVFFDVREEERYSDTIDRHFRHTVLRIGYNYEGLTEIGGLVLLPEQRGRPEQLGRSLAFVRFVYIALHRELFRDEIVSELMPPLETDGTSLLWEALGRNFTGLSYQEADRLSRENKEFIRSLFPQDPIYATLLPPAAQALIGQVGPSTKPVEKLLRRIGFTFARRIDPFDGGPHFHARTDEVTLVKNTRRSTVASVTEPGPDAGDALVVAEIDASPFFRAVRARVTLGPEGTTLDPAAAATLQVGPGDPVAVMPFALP
jgi:arginine N-succinyltransferase